MKLSIIIPCFNAELYLRTAIESVLNQHPKPMEIIVVDDGSTDNSAFIAQSLGVKYLYQPNAGPAAARNTGLHHATGEWILFLDADDWVMPNTFSIVTETIQNHPTQLFFWNKSQIHYEKNELPIGFRFNGTAEIHLVQLGSMFFHKKLCDQLGNFDTSTTPAEDMDWLKRVMDSNIFIHKLEHIGLTYRRHGKNLTQLADFKNMALMLKILKNSIDRRKNEIS